MPFNVNEFSSSIKGGLARQTHFEVSIYPPAFLQRLINSSSYEASISYLCGVAQLPSRSMSTLDFSRYGLGLQQKMVVGSTYDPLNLDIYCDSKAENIKILHKWMDLIFPPQAPGGEGGNKNGQHVEYKDKYAAKIVLTQYDAQGDKIANWNFMEAFPITLGTISFNWAAKNDFIMIPVTFAYTYYIEEGQETNNIAPQNGPSSPAQNNQLPANKTIPDGQNITPIVGF